MSAETASSTKTFDLYVPLLNEGTDVLRPTKGIWLGDDEAQVLAAADYDPRTEEWVFPPGSRVKCMSEVRGGRQLLVARQLVDRKLPGA